MIFLPNFRVWDFGISKHLAFFSEFKCYSFRAAGAATGHNSAHNWWAEVPSGRLALGILINEGRVFVAQAEACATEHPILCELWS